MASVVYAWEFGGGLGHLTRATAVAREYRRQGHEVAFAVKDVASARLVLPAGQHRISQAPHCSPAARVAGHRPVSYAEILLTLGLGDVRTLASLVRAWLDFFELAQPDVVMLDYSPIAMLAARIAGLRHCTIGHGFFLPPRLGPVPPFIDGADPQRVVRSEALVLDAINHVRRQFGRPALQRFADFFEVDVELLTTWPETEHYTQRRDATYWGPILMSGVGREPDWPSAGGPRVFVYLRGQDDASLPVLMAIRAINAVALVYAPGLRTAVVDRLRSDRIRFSSTPYETGQAIASANAVVCNGGFGTVWEALLAGKPMLCLPLHQEQQIVAQRLEALRVAIMGKRSTIVASLLQLLRGGVHRRAAEVIAARYADTNDDARLSELVAVSLGRPSPQDTARDRSSDRPR